MTLPARITLIASLALCSPSLAQRDLKDLPNPDPEVERQSFQVPDDVQVSLWAAEPLLFKPIQINFDERGRLWVACSKSYPQIKPGETANDQVVVLEDRDRDGKADTSTVFADGLLIPTGVLPGDGGAYVANSTELIHLADSDNDGRADRKRVVLSGFGTEDTHHIIHTLRWGYDGLLYFNQSVYIHSHVETPFGPRRLGGGGIWQLRPESKKLEVFIRGLVNPWGHHYDHAGNHFATDGAGFEGVAYLIPGATYTAISNPERYLHGLNPGSPKYCGAEFLSGRAVPDAYRGHLVTNDFRANRVVRFELSTDGSGFAARERQPLIRSSHIAFRPIDAKMGPDGALYIADWYNPIIQHGEVDFRDDRRDHTRGRIWRLSFKNTTPVEPPNLASAEIPALLDALDAPEGFTREHARRLLRERGATHVLPLLDAWTAHQPTNARKREALWLRHALDAPSAPLLKELLASSDPDLRTTATRIAGAWAQRLDSGLSLLAPLAEDEHPRVRLEAVRALASLPDPDAPALALRALARPVDSNLDYALWLTARETSPRWLPRLQRNENVFVTDAQAVFALLAVNIPEIVGPLMDRYKAGRIPPADEERVLTALGQLGGPPELSRVFELATSDSLPGPRRARLLDALATAERRRQVRPDCPLERLALILADSQAEPSLRASAARAAGAWKVHDLRPYLANHLAANSRQEWLVRQAAIDALVEMGGAASIHTLEAIDHSAEQPRARLAALAGLAPLDLRIAATRGALLLASLDPAADGSDPAPLINALTRRKGGSLALEKALDRQSLSPDIARLAIRAARAAGSDQSPLIAALAKSGGLDSSAGWSKLPPDQARSLAAEALAQGNPARGETLYRRHDLSCQNCHAIAGAGSLLGPGLESIGASAPTDYLVESLLYPDKAIKEGYHSVVLATTDGQILTGRELGLDSGRIRLVTADLKEILVDPADIEERRQAGSLMPAGLIDDLTRSELLDLVAFLSSLGKPGPYSVGTDRAIRSWRVIEPTDASQSPIRRAGLDSLAGPSPAGQAEPFAPPSPDILQRPVYSLVSGALPLDGLPSLHAYNNAPPLIVARAWIDVSTPGPILLRLNASRGVRLWLGPDREIPAADAMTIPLDRGVYALTFVLDLTQFPASELRAVLDDIPGSPAQARPLLSPSPTR